MKLPFDGAVTKFFEKNAPAEMRDAIKHANNNDVLSATYPYPQRMPRKQYEREMQALQIEKAKLQASLQASGRRLAIVFEGRDSAGKGGTISRCRANLNPRVARVVALSKPTETERGQWYFQRYAKHLPSAGETIFFDRSWYNRGVVEHVFDFCTAQQREKFFHQVCPFEEMIVNDNIVLIKFWLNVSREEQLRRMLQRERDPLKQWKLSTIDVEGLKRWDAYTAAIAETLERSHTTDAPWTVVRSDDKRRARLTAIRIILHRMDYENKDHSAIGAIDTSICGGPEIWHA